MMCTLARTGKGERMRKIFMLLLVVFLSLLFLPITLIYSVLTGLSEGLGQWGQSLSDCLVEYVIDKEN